jgi:hypothetical protein
VIGLYASQHRERQHHPRHVVRKQQGLPLPTRQAAGRQPWRAAVPLPLTLLPLRRLPLPPTAPLLILQQQQQPPLPPQEEEAAARAGRSGRSTVAAAAAAAAAGGGGGGARGEKRSLDGSSSSDARERALAKLSKR